MEFLTSSIRGPHEAYDTCSPASHPKVFINKLTRLPTPSSYANETFNQHFDNSVNTDAANPVNTQEIEKKVTQKDMKTKQKKRHSFTSWFRRSHKHEPETAEKVNEDVIDDTSCLDTTVGTTKPISDDEHDHKIHPTVTSKIQSPQHAQSSFRKLFKRKRERSFVKEFQDIGGDGTGTFKRSKSIRERFFGIKNVTSIATVGQTSETKTPETSVYDVSETLTQRYMNNNYDKLVQDMDAIPFDLTVSEPVSIRYKVTKLIQAWSPSKKAAKDLFSDFQLDTTMLTTSSDTDDEEWNPYMTAKKNNSTESNTKKANLTEGKHIPEDDHQGTIKDTSRFSTLKRRLTIVWRPAALQLVNGEGPRISNVDQDHLNTDNDTASFISQSSTLDFHLEKAGRDEEDAFWNWKDTADIEQSTIRGSERLQFEDNPFTCSTGRTLRVSGEMKKSATQVSSQGKFTKLGNSIDDVSDFTMTGSTRCVGPGLQTGVTEMASTAPPSSRESMTQNGCTTFKRNTRGSIASADEQQSKRAVSPDATVSSPQWSVTDIQATAFIRRVTRTLSADREPSSSDSHGEGIEDEFRDPTDFEEIKNLVRMSQQRYRKELRASSSRVWV